MSTAVQTGTIETRVPARLDRLPWSKFHWRVVIGLGTVWILDGLEVTMVGSVASRLTEPDSGLGLSSGQVGLAAAIYIVGACSGALFFGQLTDRFGRKKLFLITLLVYIVATVATAFAFSPWYFYLARFFTGAGIGGEYAAINSAIDELIPARARGRVDLMINGSFWLGAALGAALALLLLIPGLLPDFYDWRVAFLLGAVLGVGILLVRRNVPESPRWLFIHGRQDEAERIVDGIERAVVDQTGEPLPEPERSLTVRQRTTIPFRQIAEVAFKLYPKRSVLGIALFIGQAFIYNGVTFNLGLLFGTFYGVSSAIVPAFFIIWAIGNFLGPLTLGRLFDTVGRIPMIAGCYLGSAALTVPLALLFVNGALNRWTFLALIVAVFFFASAGASAAYLTVSEVFPMETRALAIAFFYAVGTAAGGIAGPLLFGTLIGTEQRGYVMIAFLIGAGVMALGGIAELFLGVRAEGADLESIAKPLTAEDAEQGPEPQQSDGHLQDARLRREEAEQARAQAAEHRAAALELQLSGGERDGDRYRAEEALAEMSELRGRALDEQAGAHEELAAAGGSASRSSAAALARAQAAEQRARSLSEQERQLAAEDDAEAEMRGVLAAAAAERARAREQRAQVEESHAEAEAGGGDATVSRARAEMNELWGQMHDARASVEESRAEQDPAGVTAAERQASDAEQRALAAEQRVVAAEHRAAAEGVRGERESVERTQAEQQEAARRRQEAEELERRVRERVASRESRERAGLRRLRPGPGSQLHAGPAGGIDAGSGATAEVALDREIDMLARALEEHGPLDRQDLARLVGARYWGPGRFGDALRAAVNEGRARQLSRRSYGPPERS